MCSSQPPRTTLLWQQLSRIGSLLFCIQSSSMHCRQRRQHTESGGYHLMDGITNLLLRLHDHDLIQQGSMYIQGYYNIDCNTDDDIHRINMNHALYFYYFLFFREQIFCWHIHFTYIYTHTHTSTVVSTDNLILFVALLWRAGRVLYEGLTRWLRYCLDREIDQ